MAPLINEPGDLDAGEFAIAGLGLESRQELHVERRSPPLSMRLMVEEVVPIR